MITTTSLLPAPVQAYFDRSLLAIPYPNLIYGLAAEQRVIPQNSGTLWRGRQYKRLGTAEVPLGNNGLEPPPEVPQATDIDAKINWYGKSIILNEQVVLQNQDPVLNTMVELLGMSLRETEDKLLRDMLVSTATSINATGGNNGDMPTQVTASDIEKITTNLVGNNAFTVTDHVEAQDKIGTAPIANSFVAMAHTDITPDLDAIPRFIPTNEYSQYEKRLNSEWGSYRKMRFFVSPNGAIVKNASAMGKDVYPIMMCGLKAFGCIKQAGASAKFIYRDPMFSGALAQNGTVAYKFASAQTIFQDEWIQKLNVTVTS